jgi:multidrug efflux pump subunit AcrB
MTMNLHVTALLSGTDPALVQQVSDAVNNAVREAIDAVPGVSYSSSMGATELA